MIEEAAEFIWKLWILQLFWINNQLYCTDVNYTCTVYACTIFARILPNLINYSRTSNVGLGVSESFDQKHYYSKTRKKDMFKE